MRKVVGVLLVASLSGCSLPASQPPTRSPSDATKAPASPRTSEAVPTATDEDPSSPSPSATVREPATPAPTPTAEPSDELAVVLDVFGPKWGPAAARVADCESGGDTTPGAEPITINADAKNGQHAGAFQLSREFQEARANKLGFSWAQMFEIRPNAEVAKDLFEEKGDSFDPPNGWTCAWAA